MIKRIFLYLFITIFLLIISFIVTVSFITKIELEKSIIAINNYEKQQSLKNISEKLKLVNVIISNRYKTLKEDEIKNHISSLKATINSINTMLNQFKTLNFKNYSTYMNMYLTNLKYNIKIVKNNTIFNSNNILETGTNYYLSCNPLENYGECEIDKKNNFIYIQYNMGYKFFIVGEIEKHYNSEKLKTEILNILQTIPNIKIFNKLQQITTKDYFVTTFKPLNIHYGIKLNYNEIDKTSKKLSNNLIVELKQFIFIYILIFTLFFIINYFIFRVFKTKIDLIDKIFEETKNKASTDKLTGFLNRETFEIEIKEKKGMLLILDVDNFKYINDTFGHDKGDEILKEFSWFLNKYFKEDIIGRWGGDEFLILTDKDKQYIKEVDSNINKRLLELQKTFDKKLEKQLSLSVGGCEKEVEFEIKFKNADLALYKSKKMGKGKTTFYNDLQYLKMEKEDL